MRDANPILIIGGAGFMGEVLTRKLAGMGASIRVVDLPERESRVSSIEGVTFEGLDFTSLNADDPVFKGIGAIIHLGWTSNPRRSMEEPAADAQRNLISSLRILEAALANRVHTFLFASSGGTVYGDAGAAPITETRLPSPISAYGACKLAVERYMSVMAQAPMRAIALRVANAYGAGQLRGVEVGSIANFIGRLARGEAIEIWGDGETVRDYVFITDVAEAFRLCLDPSIAAPSGAYNVGTGKGHSLNELVVQISAIAERTVPVRHLPARGFDVREIVLDSSKLRSATGWSPKVSLQAGIQILWQALADQAAGGDRY